MPTHGQDIMRKLNSVSMVIWPTNKIHANVTVPFGSEEEKMKKEKELTLGKNSECGLQCQKLMKLFILDAINIHLEYLQEQKVRRWLAGANQSHNISQESALKKLVMTACVTVELSMVNMK